MLRLPGGDVSPLCLLINTWPSNYSVLECCGPSCGWIITVASVTVTLHTWTCEGEHTCARSHSRSVKGHGSRALQWLIGTVWRIRADSERPWNNLKRSSNQSSLWWFLIYRHTSDHTDHFVTTCSVSYSADFPCLFETVSTVKQCSSLFSSCLSH